MILTVYIVSTGHHEYLNTALSSVVTHLSEIRLVLVETSSSHEELEQSKLIADKSGVGLTNLKDFTLPKVANYVLESTNTEFIMRLDADDWLDEEFLPIMLEAINNSSEDAFIPSYVETDHVGKHIRDVNRSRLATATIKDNPAHGACTIFRTEFLKKIGGYSTCYDRQDGYYVWLKLLKFGTFACVPKAKFFYRQHSRNITNNQRELWAVRASMLIDEAFHEAKRESVCILPILTQDTFFGGIVMQPFAGYESLLAYELRDLSIECKVVVYGPKTLSDIVPNRQNIQFIARDKFSENQWLDIETEVLPRLDMTEGYVCVRNIEYPFVNSKYIAAAIAAVHLFKANMCITVEELKRDIYHPTETGLQIIDTDSVQEDDRRYRRSGGVTVKRIIDGRLRANDLITSIPTDAMSAIRVSELKDLIDLKEILK